MLFFSSSKHYSIKILTPPPCNLATNMSYRLNPTVFYSTIPIVALHHQTYSYSLLVPQPHPFLVIFYIEGSSWSLITNFQPHTYHPPLPKYEESYHSSITGNPFYPGLFSHILLLSIHTLLV